eukprot:scaffold298900_cov33-Tisochrysis_lutea.AAC.6
MSVCPSPLGLAVAQPPLAVSSLRSLATPLPRLPLSLSSPLLLGLAGHTRPPLSLPSAACRPLGPPPSDSFLVDE